MNEFSKKTLKIWITNWIKENKFQRTRQIEFDKESIAQFFFRYYFIHPPENEQSLQTEMIQLLKNAELVANRQKRVKIVASDIAIQLK